MVFRKYQIDGNIKGIDAEVDKQLGIDKMNKKAYQYEKLWIDAEIKYCLTMAGFSSVALILLFVANPSQKNAAVVKITRIS